MSLYILSLKFRLDQLKKMKKLGFNVVKNIRIKTFNLEILQHLLKQFKKESIYIIDGIIIRHNNNYGFNTSGNPDYAFAFKMVLEEQIEDAVVERIHLECIKVWSIVSTN